MIYCIFNKFTVHLLNLLYLSRIHCICNELTVYLVNLIYIQLIFCVFNQFTVWEVLLWALREGTPPLTMNVIQPPAPHHREVLLWALREGTPPHYERHLASRLSPHESHYHGNHKLIQIFLNTYLVNLLNI